MVNYRDAWSYNGLALADPEESDAEIRYRLLDKSGKVVATAIYPLDMNGIPAAVEFFGNVQLAETIHRFLYHANDIVCPYCLTESWNNALNACDSCCCQ